MKEGQQILKCRDDRDPVMLTLKKGDAGAEDTFEPEEGSVSTWTKTGEAIRVGTLRTRIEPWLTALSQPEHLSLLIGSGLPRAVHSIATGKDSAPMEPVVFKQFKGEIEAEVKEAAKRAGRKSPNVEDQLRVGGELLRGLEILSSGDAPLAKKAEALGKELRQLLEQIAEAILKMESGMLAAQGEKRTQAFNFLVSFLMSFASRSGTRERLHIFTTNYDRFIEAGAEIAGLHLMDRFVGSLAPVFRSSRLEVDMHYNPPGMRGEPRYLEGVARYTKLHGSVDWADVEGSIRRLGVPFGSDTVQNYLEAAGLRGEGALRLMVYPNSAKDRETASYPYVDLFRDMAASICRPNCTVICYGYGFGDEHINRVLEDMLTIPSTHLVVISMGDPLGRIMRTYGNLGRHAQVTLLLGDHLADLQVLVDNYLPKPAIDRTTFRMAELLKARWGSERGDSGPKTGGENPAEAH